VRNANPLHRPLTGVEAGRGGGKLVDDGIDDRNNDRSNDRDNGRIDEWLEFAVRVGTQATIRVWRARGFAGRLRGLIARPLPAPGSGLWIEPCAAVHTFGVRGPLDLVFVSTCMVVQRIDAAVPARRVRAANGARAVLELQAGEAARAGLRVGTRLAWRHGAAAAPVPTSAIEGGRRWDP